MSSSHLQERFQVHHGDSLAIIPTLPEVDAVITDPPYCSGGMMRGDRVSSTGSKYVSSDAKHGLPDFCGDSRDQRGFTVWMGLLLAAARERTRIGGHLLCFIDWRQLPVLTDAVQTGGWVWRGIIPWDKVNARPRANGFRAQAEYVVWATNGPLDSDKSNAKYHPGVLRHSIPGPKERKHQTQKPLEIMRALCKVAPEEGTILDPFMGSGTTGVAALESGRRFIGIEADGHYFTTASRRLTETKPLEAELS